MALAFVAWFLIAAAATATVAFTAGPGAGVYELLPVRALAALVVWLVMRRNWPK